MNLVNRKKAFIALAIISTISTLIIGGFVIKQKIFTEVEKTTGCEKMDWTLLKNKIIQYDINDDEIYGLNYLGGTCRFYYRVKSSDINKFLKIFKETNNVYLKRSLLNFFRNVDDHDLIINNKELVSLLKDILKSEYSDLSEISVKILFEFNLIGIDEAIEMQKSLQDSSIRREFIIQIIDLKDIDKAKLYIFLKSLIEGQDKTLSSLAFKKIADLEGYDKWQTWQWSEWFSKIILKAADNDFNLLLDLYPSEMLEITRKYPESNFTKACIEFRSRFPNDSYFGGLYIDQIRRPFFDKKEYSMYADFIRKYPDHPALNDILYRQARAYETNGDYSKAISYYYDSIKVGNSDIFSSKVGDRILLIINFLMSHDSIDKFILSNPTHPLVPYLEYTKSVHSIRENNLVQGSEEIKKFIDKYKHKSVKDFYEITKSKRNLYPSQTSYFNSYFWSEVEKQYEFTKKLISLRSIAESDESLYKEAALWHYTDFSAHNLLSLDSGYASILNFLPNTWDGQVSMDKYLITPDAYKIIITNLKLSSRHYRSILVLEKLLKTYPNSKLAAKAKYSIGLNYYLINQNQYSPDIHDSQVQGIKTFREFVDQFPDSSMADDALISIAYMSQDKNEKTQVLQQMLSKYQSGDRKRDAEKMSSGDSSSSSRFRFYQNNEPKYIQLGIQMTNIHGGKVSVWKVVENSLAHKSGLQDGDIIDKLMGKSVKSASDMEGKIKTYRVGDIIRLQILRKGKVSILEIETSEPEKIR